MNKNKNTLTWNTVALSVPIPTAEAGDATGDDNHEDDGDAAHDEEELQVDLAVLPGEPGPTLTGDGALPNDALAILVAKVAFRCGSYNINR